MMDSTLTQLFNHIIEKELEMVKQSQENEKLKKLVEELQKMNEELKAAGGKK